jgi:hypothetical protein
MSQWQPIETAPKDGTLILAIDGLKMIARPSWYFAPSSQTFGWLKDNGRYWKPTHWQPMPELSPSPSHEGAA